MRRVLTLIAAVCLAVVLACGTTGCFGPSDADVAAKNISKAAEQFEINRRIVFINGITDKYLFVIEGACSVETTSAGLAGSLEATCLTGKNEKGEKQFKKVYMGLADNVTYVVDQIGTVNVSTARYRVIFKPEAIVPNFDRPSGG